jgi:hypothetical protein
MRRPAAVLALLAFPVLAQAANNPLKDKVAESLKRFKDVEVAIQEGYKPMACVSGPMGGSMGMHYANPSLIDDDVDLTKPEAIMYEPQGDGTMELIGVEYITTKGPAQLDGHLFNYYGAPNRYGLPAFYELHVWAWRENKDGTFADMNKDVSCDAMMPMAK